jgi:hypothetical protein
MSLLSVDLGRAFDEIVANEEGLRFQRIAVRILRQTWPQIVASEPKKDLGADGIVPIQLAEDRTERVVACSLTASYAKLLADAQKIKRNFPSATILLFATPRSVSNQLQKGWKEELKNATGLNLIVFSREDLISRLLDPANAAIRDSEFGPEQGVAVDLHIIGAKIRNAAAETLKSWEAHRGIGQFPLIQLRLADISSNGQYGEPSILDEVAQSLLQGGRIVLEASPGSGKTVTLVQLTQRLTALDATPLLIHLPQWANVDRELFDFIATALPAFSREKIASSDLSRSIQTMPSVLLLNGWNEISSASREKMEERLRGADRDLRQIGIIVATRARSVTPPFQSAKYIGIRTVSRQERRQYLVDALGDDGARFATELDSDRALDDLTRSPFILYWAMRLRKKAIRSVPSTRMQILADVARLYEEEPDHKNAILREPLEGCAGSYLVALARQMTAVGETTVSEAGARKTCKAVRDDLFQAGQVIKDYSPAELLAALCDHHLLKRLPANEGFYDFAHQQFQDFYSATFLEEQLCLALANTTLRDKFIAAYVNSPAWEEAFKMLAADIGVLPVSDQGSLRASLLVEAAMSVDLVFAATLVFLCCEQLPSNIRTQFVRKVKSWYLLGEESHQTCALAAMFGSGLSEFRDVVVPLCTSTNQQVRLNTYRSAKDFRLKVFGNDWKQTVAAWDEPARKDFIGEMITSFNMVEIGEYYALNDPSLEIRKESIRYLAWMGARDRVLAALKQLPETEIDGVLLRLHRSEIPEEMQQRISAALESKASTEQNPINRIQILLSQVEQGYEYAAELIKAELNAVRGQPFPPTAQNILGLAIRALQTFDASWTNEWLSRQVADGTLFAPQWAGIITELPVAVRDEVFLKVTTEDLKNQEDRYIALLLTTPDLVIAQEAFRRYLIIRKELKESRPLHTDVRWTISRQLEEFFRRMPAAMVMDVLDDYLTNKLEDHSLRCTVALLNGVGRYDPTEQRPLDMRPELAPSALEKIRNYLKRAAVYARGLNEPDGELIAYIGSALARVGSIEDLSDLNSLIQADVARWNAVEEAAAKGQRVQRQGWSIWHVKSATMLAGDKADQVLIPLLSDYHYGEWVANALKDLARIDNGAFPNSRSPNIYTQFWDARQQKPSGRYDEFKRERYAAAVKSAVVRLSQESPTNIHLLQKLAAVLAALDGPASADVIYQAIELPLKFSGWTRLAALEALVAGGVSVRLAAVSKVLADTLQDVRPKGYFNSDQDRDLVIGLVKLFPFSDDPALGISKLEEMFSSRTLQPYEFRRMVSSLGQCRRPEALDLLLSHAETDGSGFKQQESEWIHAISDLGGEKAITTLFRFIDPDERPFTLEGVHRSGVYDVVAKELDRFASSDECVQQRLYSLAHKQLSDWQKYILMKSFANLGTIDAILAGINLYQSGPSTRIPSAISDAFEKHVLSRRPHEVYANSYTLEPTQATSLRRTLFERMIVTPQLKWPIFTLLGQIEVWRLAHGKPIDEPRHPSLMSGYAWPPLELMAN